MTRTLLTALLVLTSPAFAQSNPFEWDRPDPSTQLAEDATAIPLGKGALFVPALTDPALEPPIVLVSANGAVRDIATGERAIVDPGTYTVIVSSGPPGQGIAQTVEVADGATTVVPVRWGAVRVEVVDEKRVPHRGGYELISTATREPIGTGFGADTLQGESPLTWLLSPGVYRIVKVGSNYRALRDFATVYVPEGGFVRYRLVTDPDTGDFLGSGIVLPDEFGTPRRNEHPWFKSLILGADGAYAQQNNVVGVSNQSVVTGNLFLDGQFAYRHGDQTASALFQIEEGATQLRPWDATPLPFVKSRDRLRADLLYTWFLRERVGPYARVAATTHAFRTGLLVTEDTAFVREHADGTTDVEDVSAGQTFHIANAWSPTIVREGAGLNWRVSSKRWYTLNLRAGLGMRQNRYGGSWLPDDNPDTPQADYVEVPSYNSTGLESTVIGTVRLPGWATYATDVELFADIQGHPALEWRNTLSVRLTRNLSVNYYANIDYLPLVVERAQFEQSVLLRASFGLL